ncbi:MAG: hypothetical protein A3G34_04255 [Candidatus Lindowbacteria bacterium RIFCSPLOWO2_12_FULL_62_27]|nr:MAG: hypothetical protein A3G34_04255 [Candidatus Lindowbacteria bacterium RIFCSPLOWO2_12_FULL_62_27]
MNPGRKILAIWILLAGFAIALAGYGLYRMIATGLIPSPFRRAAPARPAIVSAVGEPVLHGPPTLSKVEQIDYVSGEYILFRVAFSGGMEEADFDSIQIFGGRDASGAALRYSFDVRQEREAWLRIHGIDTGLVTVRIPAGVRAKHGLWKWAADSVVTVPVSSYAHVTDIRAEQREKDILIAVSFPVRVESLPTNIDSHITVTPAVNFRAEPSENRVLLIGPFAPARTYSVRVLQGFEPRPGMRMRSDHAGTVRTPAAEPFLKFASYRTYHFRGGQMTLPIEHAHVHTLRLTAYRVYPNNLIEYLNRPNMQDLGDPVRSDTATVAEPEKAEGLTRIPLDRWIGPSALGVYELVASAESRREDEWNEEGYLSARKLIVVTDLGVIVKSGAPDAPTVVLVRSLKTTLPVTGAKVTAYSRKNQIVAAGVTDRIGRASLEGIEDKARLIIVETAADWTFIPLDGPPLNRTDFDVGGRPFVRNRYEAFVYFDRGAYRPGDTVHLNAIIRDPGRTAPPPMPVEIAVLRPDRKLFRKFVLMTDENGSAGLDLEIPAYARLGAYAVSAGMPGARMSYGSGAFSVEEFMPDRMKVDLRLKSPKIDAGKPAMFAVSAEHLFGGAAAGRAVQARVHLRCTPFSPKGFEDFRFDHPLNAFEQEGVSLNDRRLDTNGVAEFSYELPAHIKPSGRVMVQVSASVLEAGGRAVTATREWPADVYPYYIGLRLNRTPDAGHHYEVEAAAVLPDGTPAIQAETATVVVSHLVWRSSHIREPNGRYRYQSVRIPTEIHRETLMLKNGRGAAQLVLPEGGYYSVELFGVASNRAGLTASVYDDGMDHEPDKTQLEKLELDADPPASAYVVGETAVLTVRAPFPGRLIYALEQDRVLSIHELPMPKTIAQIPIPVRPAHLPQVFVSALVVRGASKNLDGEVIRAMGVVRLRIREPDKELSVRIEAPETVRPNEPFTALVFARPAATVTVAAVDEGILSLTDFQSPDPARFFFSDRRHSVETYDRYDDLFPEFNRIPAAGGDTARRKHLPRPTARRVESAVIWAKFKVDGTGRKELKLKAPDFTGRLRFMVVAAGRAGVGSREAVMTVREPLMVELSAPRFAAPGDRFELPVTVFNRTGRPDTVQIELAVADTCTATVEPRAYKAMLLNESETTFWFSVRAGGATGSIQFLAEAHGTAHRTRRRVSVPLRHAAPAVTTVESLIIPPGKRGQFRLAGKFVMGAGDATLMVTSNPFVRLAGALDYVVRYPYGCVEQTTSQTFPMLYLADLAAAVHPGKFSPGQIQTYVQAGIFRVLSMQTADGGLAYWPGNAESYPWGSCYGGHMLVEAAQAGYMVFPESLAHLKQYLKTLLAGSESPDIRAYAAYVLALAGERVIPDLERFSADPRLTDAGRFHAAAAYAAAGDIAMARALFDADAVRQDHPADRELGGTLNSDIRQDAVMLSALLSVHSEHPLIAKIADRMISRMNRGRWPNTHDNGFALIALGKLARGMRGRPAHHPGEVFADGGVAGRFGGDTVTRFQFDSVDTITVESRGQAGMMPLHAVLTASGIPATPDMSDRSDGMKIRRTFLTPGGRRADRFVQGELYVAELTVHGDASFENVVVLDLLPAGFEIENPRLATAAKHGLEGLPDIDDPFREDYLEMRDDRLALFGTVHRHGGAFRYLVRAVTPGDFVLPHILAECMYDPSRFARSGAGRIAVDRAP